ncbi:hypothetical protein DFQ28_007367 [Apophysomyces sp. BC1034]|nr:hypothetical protein DFQ28_007367 [Apophysomyces sp. BC1034]
MPLASTAKRLQREIEDIQTDPDAKIELRLTDDLDQYYAVILGPPGTAYEGGKFLIDIHLGDDFPFRPPRVKFLTAGAICLDILKNNWSPAMTLKTVLLSLQVLLASPVPDDPQDAQVAAHLRRDPDDFQRTAQYWTQVYAHGERTDHRTFANGD